MEQCPACVKAKVPYANLSMRYPDVVFLKSPCGGELSRIYNIPAYPTFVILDAKGEKVGQVVGWKEKDIVNLIESASKKKAPMKEMERRAPKKEIPMSEMMEKEMKAKKEMAVKKEMKAERKRAATMPRPEMPVREEIAEEGVVIELESADKFEGLKNSGKPMVLDFYTTWCGPCKMMKPVFEKFAKENPDVIFVSIDAEKFLPLSGKYSVTGYPTFVFINARGEIVTCHSGTLAESLMRAKINQVSGKKGGQVIIHEEKEIVRPGAPSGRPMMKEMPRMKEMPMMEKGMMMEERKGKSRRQKGY
jgi:thiol-disulfide isomerase/thioredoxin